MKEERGREEMEEESETRREKKEILVTQGCGRLQSYE